MEYVSIASARANLGALAGRAQQAHEATVLTEHGRPVAAIVPVDVLEDYEDAMAVLDYERRRKAGTLEPGIPHEEFMAQLEAEDRGQAQAS